MRSQSQIAALETEIEELKQEKTNAQSSSLQAMTNIPGYQEEFERLKGDAIKEIRKAKRTKIISTIISIFTIPIGAAIVYGIFAITNFTTFLEMDQNFTQIFYVVMAGVFVLIEINTILTLIKTIFINPDVIPDATLSYLSLTAKEHVLDPKGSVIREKYGTSKWTSVTNT